MEERDEDIENRFNYHAPGPGKAASHEAIRGVFKSVAYVVKGLPPGREQSLAMTKLEEAMFWANAAIARNG